MNKTFLLLLTLFAVTINYAQQQGFSYKALISDNGSVVPNQAIVVQFTILENGSTIVYQEEHISTTDSNGILIVTLGEGTPTNGLFNSIDWVQEQFLKVVIDTGNGLTDFGTTAFKAVPYAKYASKSDFNNLENIPATILDGDDDTQLTETQVDAFVANNGYLTSEVDGSITNEIQSLTLNGSQLSITNGNMVTLPEGVAYSAGTGISITGGVITNTGDTSSVNEIQNLTLNGGQLSITNGNMVTLPTSSGGGAEKIDDLNDGKSDSNGSSVFLGTTAGLNDNGTDNRNVGIGYQAAYSTTSGQLNTAIGYAAFYHNTTGEYNTATGYGALYYNSIGSFNTATGLAALNDNTTGENNTAMGQKALLRNTTGKMNTATGSESLVFNLVGERNTANGYQSLYNNKGSNNTAIGVLALHNNDTGTKNTAVGDGALYNNTTGSNNIAIGYNAQFEQTVNNAIFISSGFTRNGDVSNSATLGNTSMTWIGGQVGWSSWSDKRIKNNIQENVPGLDFIKALRPVTYHLDIHKQNELIRGEKSSKDEEEWDSKYDIENIQMTGFIAQEVANAAEISGYDFSGVHKSNDDIGMYSIRYAEFVVPLVKAVQELEADNTLKEQKIQELEKRLARIETILEK